ncbi:hypothetical protein [Kribbella sp. HUAS MG21]|uniref:Uncharacterized protein n=1 Tax=Kribbella sp. HUAS MG21 TaxID=3160966 RepID=A0AAU7TKJ1_9ACTN
MTGRRARVAARTVAALAAAVVLVPSGSALADNIEPQPTDWPTVKPVEQGNAAEPQPSDWPTVPATGDTGQAVEPQPVDWPTPEGEN